MKTLSTQSLRTSIYSFILLAGLSFATMSSAQVMVVVGAKSTANKLSKDQAAALFLGKSFQLPGAGIPVLIDQGENTEARQIFYNKVAEKTPVQVKAIWSRLVFSGKGTLPKEVANSEDVKKLLNANPDAIGYIEKAAVDASVKVLLAVE
jgi:ABC-type phosphate transport system substrate-binding protein